MQHSENNQTLVLSWYTQSERLCSFVSVDRKTELIKPDLVNYTSQQVNMVAVV